MTNEQPIQETEVIQTPTQTEAITEVLVDPIYKHKDGRIFTKNQLITKMGLTEDRIKDGLSKGMITQVGDTDDPDQQFKHKDGRIFSMKEFAAQGVNKDRVAAGIERGMIVPIEKKNQVAIAKPVLQTQKQEPPVSTNGAAAGASVSTTLPAEEKAVEPTVAAAPPTPTPAVEAPTTPPIEEQVPVSIFDEAKQYSLLKNKKKTEKQEFAGAEPGVMESLDVEVDDKDAQEQAKKMKEAADAKGVDYDVLDGVNKMYDENHPGFNIQTPKEELEYDYVNNRARFDQKYNLIKSRQALSKTLRSKFSPDEAHRQYEILAGTDDNIIQNASTFAELTSAISDNTNQLIASANAGDYDNKKEILADRQAGFANVYADFANKHPESFEVDPLNRVLNSENKILGWHFVQDLNPEEIGKYRAALIPDEDIKDNWQAQTAKQQATKQLEQIGLNIRKSNSASRLKELTSELELDVEALNGFINDAKNDPANAKGYMDNYNEFLPTYEKHMEEYNKLNGLDQKLSADYTNLNDDSQYGYANYYERQGILQDLTDQKHGFLTQPFLKLGQAGYNTGAMVVDFIKAPFLSQRNREVDMATLMGTNIAMENELRVSPKNQLGKIPYVMKPDFEVAYDYIMNSKSLSKQEKQDKVYNLIINNPDGLQINPKGRETNLTLGSLWYGMTNLAADLAPYLFIETLTGGTATEGIAPSVLKKFSSSFIAAFTTGFHQSYLDAISRGSQNPYADAMRSATISSLAMAGAGTPDIMRKIIGTKSVVGKMINKMTDKEILAVLRTEPKALSVFKKAYNFSGKMAGATLEGFKGGTKMVTLTTAAQAINDKMYGEVRNLEEYVDDGKLEVLKFTLFGGITGGLTRGFTEKYGDLTKSAMFEAGANPKKFLDALELKIKNNDISKTDADQIRNNIETASKIFKTTYFGDSKGQPLDDASSRDLLFLKMQEADLEKILKDRIPAELEKKLTNRLLNIKEKINDLRDGIEAPERKYRSVDVLTQGNIIAGDIIKNKEGVAGEVLQVNDNKTVVIKDIQTGEKFLWKPEDIDVKAPEPVVKPIPTFGPPTPRPTTPAPTTKKEEVVAPEPDSDIMVGDVIDKAGSYNGKKGVFYLDGQSVIFKEEGTSKEYDLGYINDVKDTPINQYGIQHEESVVSVNEDGTFTIRGNTLKNGYSDPTQAINRDAEGNIISVTLDMPNGTKRTFRGNVAEDLAYQIHLKEITKDNATAAEFEQFINEPEQQQQVNITTVPEVTAEGTGTVNEPVQRETLQPTVPATTEPIITGVEEPELIRQAMPDARRMVDIEREFENRGYTIDTIEDNEIQIIDKDGEQVEASEDLPKELRGLAADYEAAAAKLGEVSDKAREKALAEARKVTDVEAEVVEPEQKQIGAIEQKSILTSKTDLKGDKKQSWMLEATEREVEQAKLKNTPRGAQFYPKKISDIERAIKQGKYEVAIEEGRMTAQDAKQIIESAGLEIPKTIEDLVSKNEPVERVTETQEVGTTRNTIAPKGVKQGGLFPGNRKKTYDATKEYPELTKYNDENLSTASAADMWNLLQMSHPKEYGFSVSRNAMLDEFEKRGEEIFKELGLPTNGDALYKNNYTDSVVKLSEQLDEWGSGNEWAFIAQDWNPIFDYNKEIELKQNELANLEKEREGLKAKEKDKKRSLDYHIKDTQEEIELLKESAQKLPTKKTTEPAQARVTETIEVHPTKNSVLPKGVRPGTILSIYEKEHPRQTDLTQEYPELVKYNDKNIHTASAADLWTLSQLIEPKGYGFSVSIGSLINEIKKRGDQIFEELGYPNNPEALYKSSYSGNIIKFSDFGRPFDILKEWRPIFDYNKEIEIKQKALDDINKEIKDAKDKGEEVDESDWEWDIDLLNKYIDLLKNYVSKGASKPFGEIATAKETTPAIGNGQEIEFKTAQQNTTKGIKIEVPGLEKLDTILVQDGMNYKLYELSTGLIVGESQMAASPAEAIKEIASNIPANVQDRLLNKIYQSEYNNRYNIAGEKKGITVINESPAYNAFKQAKIAEAENKPFIHDEKTRNELLKLSEEARKEGVEVGADVITTWANNKVGKVYTIEEAKKVLDAYRKKKDLEERKSKDIPYPEADRIKREPTEESLINAIQQGYKRDRWNKLPDEIKRAALEAWKKETAIYNKYGYYPSSWKNVEGFYGTLLSVGKYIGATLSKDESKKSARIQEELQVMKDNFKRIDELYKQEGLDVLKAEEGQTPKPLTITETPLPSGAQAAFNKVKNRNKPAQQQQIVETEQEVANRKYVENKIEEINKNGKPISEFKIGDQVIWASDSPVTNFKQYVEGAIKSIEGDNVVIERFKDNPMSKRFKIANLGKDALVILKQKGEPVYAGEESIRKIETTKSELPQQKGEGEKEIISGEEVSRQATEMGSDQGGISDFTANRIAEENYVVETINIEDLRELDSDLNDYLESGEIREFEGEPFQMNPIVSSKGEVIDGYNRIAQALENGETQIEVLRGVPKELPQQKGEGELPTASVEEIAKALNEKIKSKDLISDDSLTDLINNTKEKDLKNYNILSKRRFAKEFNFDLENEKDYIKYLKYRNEYLDTVLNKLNDAEGAGKSDEWFDLTNKLEDEYEDNEKELISRRELKGDSDKLSGSPNSIAEAYYKAKANGTNPELVKAVEDLIGKQAELTQQKGVGVGEVETTAKALEDVSKGKQKAIKNDEPLKEWGGHKVGDTFNVTNVDKQLPESTATPSEGNYTLTTIPISATDLNFSFSKGTDKIKEGTPALSREHWEFDNYDNYQTEQLDAIKEGFDTKKRTPIIVEKTSDGMYVVVDGHHRLTIAKELGRNNILALVREGTTEKNPKTFKSVSESYHEALKVPKQERTEQQNKLIESVNETLGIAELPQQKGVGVASSDIKTTSTKSLSVNEQRFQNRNDVTGKTLLVSDMISNREKNPESFDRVETIANNWNSAEQDPIHVWTDPKDGKTYVLSGHHRYAAALKAGIKDVKTIDRTNDFTEAQAIKFAKEDANTNRLMETQLERAKALRIKRERGDSKAEIDKFLSAEGRNASYINNLSALNPNGKTMKMVEQFGSSSDKQTQKESEQRADWIGEARRTIAGLTDAHENEMFDFLFDKNKSKRITTKADFLQKVRASVKPLTPEEPLNIARFEYKTQGESVYEEEVNSIKDQLAERQNKINEINERFNNPNAKDYISTESANYAEARKVADAKIASIEAERKALQKQLETVYSNKSKYTGGPSSGTLFSYRETRPEDFEDYVEGVTDMINESPEKTLQQVQAEVANYFNDHTPAFKKLIEQAYNEAKNNVTGRIVKTEVLQQLNKGFLKIGSTIFDNEQQLIAKAKQLSGSRFNALDNTAGFETRDGKPLGFNYDTDQVARERFDFSKLKKIGEGSDRVVFDLGNGKVLKVAKTARGLEQNIYEGDGYLDFIPNVYERGLNYVVTDNIPRIKGTDLVPIFDGETGQEIGTVTAAEMFRDLKKFHQGSWDRYDSNLQTILEKYGFGDVRGYEILYGDFSAARNWGYKDGKAYLIDAGTLGGVDMIQKYRGVQNLSDPDFRKIYYESKQLKKQYVDADKYTKFHYDENGEILGFTHGGHIYLNGQKITAKTTMEEAGHIWVNHAKETNSTLYNAGLKKVINSQYLKDVMSSEFYKKEALKQGKEGSKAYNDYMQEEALAKAISDEGAKFVTDAQRISFKEWVSKMWDNVMKAFGIRDLTPEQVAKLSLKDFAKMAAADVFAEGKPEAKAEPVVPEVKPAPKGQENVTVTETAQNAEGERVTRTETVQTKNPYLYEGTEERQRGLYTHLMEADSVSQETKNALKKNGITYQAANNAQAELMAEDILKTYNTRDALQIARGSDVHASVRSAIFAKLVDAAYVREMRAKTPEEKMRAAQQWKDLVTEYANQLTAGGQFTAYAAHFYRTSPMGFVMKENADREARFNEWSKGKEKTLEELWSEINATAEGRSLVNLEVKKAREAEREAERKIRDKKIDDFFDKLKINPKNTYGFIIPLGVLNPVIDGMKLAVKAGDRVADVVQRAIEQISEKVGDSWDKEAFRKDYEQMLTGVVGKVTKESDEAAQLRRRLEGLEKQIADLKEKIGKGGEAGKKKEIKFSGNPEVQKLIEERDQLKKENEDLLKAAKEGKYSDEAKIKAAKAAILKSIEETKRKIIDNDLSIKKKEGPTDAELIAHREEQKRLRKELEDMRKEAQEGKYDPVEMAKAEAKRKQARIDELNRRINENDFSAEKEKMEKQKTALDDELAETKRRYDEAKKQSPEYKEKKSKQFLDKLRKRLEGLSERQRNEIVQRSLKQITEAGGLNYEDFRKIVAESMGYKDLTPAEVAEVEALTKTINSVEDAEDALVANPTEANLKALDKARQNAMTAGLQLYNKTHRPADIPRTFGSLITGSLLGVVTLGKNIIQNVVMQATMRVPKALIIQPTEAALVWLGNKFSNSKAFNTSSNIVMAQKGYFKGAGRGIKRGWFNFYKGTQERDYFGKVSYQSTLAPREAVKDLKMYFSGQKPLNKTELTERMIRATLGWQPDFILRAMGFGDRPFRWAAEGAAAIQIAKLELKLADENEINAFMYAPKKFAYKTLVDQGVPKDEALLRAAEMEDRIIEAGSKAVLEQENVLSQISKFMDQGLASKKDDSRLMNISKGAASILKTTTFPFVKIPANVYWQMFKIANPEVALLQSLYHGGKTLLDGKGGDKAEARKQYEYAKDNMATAVLGYGVSVAIASLVTNGYVRPENDDETKAREREGEKPYEKGNQLNWGRMMGGDDYWIDLSWFGPIGTTMGVQAKIQEQNRRKQLKGEAIDTSWAGDFSDRFTVAEMESLNQLVYDQAGRTIGAIKGGENGLKVWAINSMNTGMNIITGATYTQMSKAMLPVVPRLKAESIMEEFKSNQQQRNALYRMYSGMPPTRVSIWGDPIKQDNSFWGVVGNMLGFQESDAHQFGAILYYDAQRTGDTRFFPTAVTDKVTIDGVEKKLTQDQKDELATYIGQARKMLVGSFVYNCALPYEVPVKGQPAKKLKYNDKDMTDADKIHALEKIYNYGKEIGFAQFQKVHKEFAPAELTPSQLGAQIKREVYDEKFKMGLERVARAKGKEIPSPTKEEELQKEIDEQNEELRKLRDEQENQQ